MKLTRFAKTFIGLMVVAAVGMTVSVVDHPQTWHRYLALTLFVVATATSRMKVKLPGMNGNMSVNLPFLLLSVVTTNAVEAILIACAATVVQTLPKPGVKVKAVQLLFNVSMVALAAGTATVLFRGLSLHHVHELSFPLLLAITTATFFLGQTLPVSIIVALTDGGAMHRIWTSIAQLTLPYYVLSAGVTSMVSSRGHLAGPLATTLLFPVMYGIYRSYKLYFAKEAQTVNLPMAIAAAAGTHS